MSTPLQSRTCMFLPVKQISKNFQGRTIQVENSYGTITLNDCVLTQVHRNICDAIFTNYEPMVLDDGSTAFAFSKYELLDYLGCKSKTNTQWLYNKFEDMRKASIVLKSNNGEKIVECSQGVLREHQRTVLKSSENGSELYGVIFSSNFMKMFKQELNIFSGSLTQNILSLNHCITQAFVRSCISHRQINKDLDSILSEIGVNRATVSPQAYNKNKRLILSESDALLELFGIELKPLKHRKKEIGVFYRQHPDVYIKKPIPSN
ncbi:TPA: hypothetical protein ACX6QG_003738 [Photobacterium damselae]